MKVLMAGIDHTKAGLELREKFAFTKNNAVWAMAACKGVEGVVGNALLCTCNRTEWYFSCGEPCGIDPRALLCRFSGADEGAEKYMDKREGEDAARHLMEVASGLHSLILGDDQIVSQVRAAADGAREAGASDPVLETLFRLAVTAGKEVKTEVKIKSVPDSAARRAVNLLEGRLGGLRKQNALVIGNGEMGRLCAELLLEKGCRVTMTLRTYRHGQNVVPAGCSTVAYDERLKAAENSRLVISATASPHFTLTLKQLEGLETKPECIVDLAVPRDVEPAAASLGVDLIDVDALGSPSGEELNADAVEKSRKIVEKELSRFNEYLNMKACYPVIGEIKKLAFKKISQSLEKREESDSVAFTVDKTVDLLLFSMKENLTPSALALIRERVRGLKG